MNLRWFSSKTVREGSELLSRVEKTFQAQRDILPPAAIERLRAACAEFKAKLTGNPAEIPAASQQFEKEANASLRPYPNAQIRENVDVILVALAIALSIRTFFLQPMAIPTGSMQPTLFGITYQNLKGGQGKETPGFFQRIYGKAVRGESYFRLVAEEEGDFEGAEEPRTLFPLVSSQTLTVGPKRYKIWFPPEQLLARAGLAKGQHFRKGEEIFNMKVTSGDHLFVNRFTYNFRKPTRGEIVIFQTTGIPDIMQDTHYIKRLIAVGGETVRLGNDRHAIIDGRRLDASTDHFQNIYSFTGPPREDHYSGHVNDFVLRESGMDVRKPSLFPDETEEIKIRDGHFFVMGDNTLNSLDSRYWRDFPQEKVIGKHAFVFWPISDRFGWGVR